MLRGDCSARSSRESAPPERTAPQASRCGGDVAGDVPTTSIAVKDTHAETCSVAPLAGRLPALAVLAEDRIGVFLASGETLFRRDTFQILP